MSILIKGMDMPKSCIDCLLFVGVKCNCANLEDYGCIYERPSDCPLVEVPPHGRLIDADKLPWFLANTDVKYETYDDWEKLCDYIDLAPTIIEADGGT